MIGPGDLRHLTRLAQLELPATEAERLRSDLDKILDYVAVLQSPPGVAPTAVPPPAPRPGSWRVDEIQSGVGAARALRGAPESIEGHFGVPAVVLSEAALSRAPAGAGRSAARVETDPGDRSAEPGESLASHEEIEPGALAGTAEDLLRRIARGETTAQGSVQTCLVRAAQAEPRLHALLSLQRESALAQAEQIDRALAAGEEVGPLAGLPVVLKDNLSQRSHPLTCASRILGEHRALYSATVVQRLEEAGAVVIGRANLDEFGMGSSCENSAFGATGNPWDLTRVPGGSSGGSAAAVAAGEAWAALGSDTGGSVRQPGAFCGVVGLKPHYGHVSRYGLVAFASSLDQVGPLGRTARDVALVYNAIQGGDPRDATSRPGDHRVDLSRMEETPRGLRVGVPRDWLAEGVDPEVVETFECAVETFRAAGVRVVDVGLPPPRQLIATYYVLANAEASSNLARFDGVRYGRRSPSATDLGRLYRASRGEGFGIEVKRRILIGTFVLSSGYYDAYYGQAQRARLELEEAMNELHREVDAVMIPAAPTPAFSRGEKTEDPLSMYLSDVFTIGANLVGNPALSFPAGKSTRGLPIGLQLYGRPEDEESLLRLARAFEREHDGAGSLRDPAGPLTRSWSEP